MCKYLMSKRGFWTKSTPALEDFFSPGAERSRLAKYQEVFQDLTRVGPTGAMCADISQDPEHRLRCGPWLPALTRSTQLVSLSRSHIYTPNELDFSQGWPSLEMEPCKKYQSCMPVASWSDFAPLDRQHLLGNGMHLFQLSCIWQYVLSNLLLRDDLQRWNPSEASLCHSALASEGAQEPSRENGARAAGSSGGACAVWRG